MYALFDCDIQKKSTLLLLFIVVLASGASLSYAVLIQL
jgi:hypothetical protein